MAGSAFSQSACRAQVRSCRADTRKRNTAPRKAAAAPPEDRHPLDTLPGHSTMNWFRNLRITRKLAVAFTLTTAMTLALGVFALVRLAL